MPDRDAVLAKIHELRENEGTNEEILSALDELIAIDGETIGLLDYRFYLLGQLERCEEALVVAQQMEKVADRKSPWNFLRIGEGHLALGQRDEAYSWFERAIRERRFRRMNAFDSPAYDPIREEDRFVDLLKEAKSNIGLDREAKPFTLQLLDGRTVQLADYRDSVVLLDFWSYDCPPCVREIPVLRDLHRELKDDGFVILGVNMDEDIDRVRSYLVEGEMDWPMACSGDGWKDETVLLYDVQAQPSMWLIDKAGVVRYFDVRGEELGKAVRDLLAE